MNAPTRLVALAAFVMGTVVSAGQAPAPGAQPPNPSFKVRVDYVEVDVSVTDKQGRVVRDLQKEDFQVLEDGKTQAITAFSTVDVPIERADRPLFASAPIEPDVRTNERPFEGRVYVMVIDDLHTRFGRSQRVKLAAKQFIERRLGANDLMAIVHTAGPSDSSQEFTGNKRLLLAAVDKTSGHKLDSATVTRTDEFNRTSDVRSPGSAVNDPADTERAFNARSALDTLTRVADWFGSVRGRRKAILFVSEGIDYDIHDMIPQTGSNHLGASMVIDSSREAIAAATRSNVAIYGIDPRGLTDLGDEAIELESFPDDTSLGIGARSLQSEIRLAQDSLRTLSEQTGGFAVVNKNDFATAYQRIVEDNSAYYVLAYYPPDPRPGRFHKIDVRVTRRDLTVRARRAYVTPKNAATTSSKSPAPSEVREALDTPLPVSGLTMRVFASPFRGVAPNASVLLDVELRGRDLQVNQAEKVTLSYAAIGVNGKVSAGNTESLAMTNLKPDTKSLIEQGGLRLLYRMNLPPGRYQVRVAARESAAGTIGAVQYDLDVPDFVKAAFSMSGLVLTSVSGSAVLTPRLDESLRAVLPAPPVALRTFPQDDEIVLFAEVYDSPGTASHLVDITTAVTADDGRVVFRAGDTRNSSDLAGQRGAYGYSARLPLKDLAPGRYVLKVEARSRLRQNEPVSRQVEFTVASAPMPGR